MAIVALTGVKRDGSSSADGIAGQPVPQRVTWARGEDGTIAITVYKQDGTPANLTGCALALTIGPANVVQGVPALLTKAAVLDVDPTTGKATFAFAAADTSDITQGRLYRYDVWLTDASTKRWQVVPTSEWYLAPAVAP